MIEVARQCMLISAMKNTAFRQNDCWTRQQWHRADTRHSTRLQRGTLAEAKRSSEIEMHFAE